MQEITVYKDIIKTFKDKQLFFKKEDIKKMIYNYLKLYNVSNYRLKKIKFNNENEYFYSINKKRLDIDCDLDLLDGIIDTEDAVFQMTSILTCIMHELTHIVDFNQFFNNDSFWNRQFKVSYDYIYKFKNIKKHAKIYEDYHDFLLFEYHAEIISFIQFENLYLNYLKDYIESYIIEKNNVFIALELVSLYENYDIHNFDISYPLLNNKEICEITDYRFLENIDLLLEKNPSELERLKLGLPLKDKTIDYLNKISNEKIKSYKLFDDIKKI